MCGVRTMGLPYAPRWSARCWSVMMKRKFGRSLMTRSRERSRAPARSHARALAQVLRRDLVDALGPAALQGIAHAELQPPDGIDLDDRALAVLQRPDALVIGPEEEEVARLQCDHGAHPRQALLDGMRDVAHRIVVAGLTVDPHAHVNAMGIGNLVGGHDARTDRGEGVERLAELLAAVRREAPGHVAA